MRRILLSVLAVVLILGLAPQRATAADSFVKYYTVASSSETLDQVASRFLGDPARSAEIYNLNAGRVQRDGRWLTGSARLSVGWTLVLPWDAVGKGVVYGVPGMTPVAGDPVSPVTPPPKPSTRKRPTPAAGCASLSVSSSTSDWAAKRVGASKAWPVSRGSNQLVAIVDSGVSNASGLFGGHLAVGVDVTGGKNGGDVDCLGTGTAMAGIVLAVVAPDATVLPIRVAASAPSATVADQVKALNLAVTAGSTVIALGDYVDPADPAVAAAISKATAHDIVVVQPATTGPGDAGVVRVAGVDAEGKPRGTYEKVDVVAPGVDVRSPAGGIGSGTHFAVAYVAAEAALVRTAFPDLTATQTVHRVELTASKIGVAATFGHGFIDPVSAVNEILPEEAAPAPQTAGRVFGSSGHTSLLAAIAVVLMLGFASLLGLRLRGMMDSDESRDARIPRQRAGGSRTLAHPVPDSGAKEEAPEAHSYGTHD